MSRIAAPRYVDPRAVADAPPGHRFGMYLPMWDEKWGLDGKSGAKANALKSVLDLRDGALLLDGVLRRQLGLAQRLPPARCLIVDAVATAPFTTGLGNEHPVENGFAFLTPYGLPYLAGSGVKGVLRHAAQRLADAGAEGFNAGAIDALFGPEDPASNGTGLPLAEAARHRGALTCWDVFPEPAGGRLAVEIMTPHHGAYYEGEDSPHDATKPNPIPFLALPAGSKLRFVMSFDPALWPAERSGSDWKALAEKALVHAFDWLGFGAKTAVGYGAMKLDEEMRQRRERDAAETAARAEVQRQAAIEQLRRNSMTPNARLVEDFIDAMRRRAEQLRGNKDRPNTDFHQRAQKLAKQASEGADWTAEDRRAAADAIQEWLPKVVALPDVKAAFKKLGLAALRGAD